MGLIKYVNKVKQGVWLILKGIVGSMVQPKFYAATKILFVCK